ncbi:hypothetical protein RF11_06348 [Thelohanellus kitauei]|uniref:Uncharacterized protein n=1 Tax=Thelohanellus kitauei TaxID=669202 RepID=A0A0C2N854_THEKT|nr:hypothetical protein RF11_06348 [Thelohanellus kitauei]
MNELAEEVQGFLALPTGSQTVSKMLSLSYHSIPRAAEYCVSLCGRVGYFSFWTPILAVVNTLRTIRSAVFEQADLCNLYVALYSAVSCLRHEIWPLAAL